MVRTITMEDPGVAVRVLHCYADYKWTGPSEPVVRLCAELNEAGWPSEIICRPNPKPDYVGLPERARRLGVGVHDALGRGGHFRMISNVRDVLRLRRVILDGGYDIVHSHGTWDHILAYWALKRLRHRIPLVRTDHGAREYRPGYWRRFYYGPEMTDHLIVLSDRFAVQAVDRFDRSTETTTTLRGGIDLDLYPPAQPPDGKRQELGLAEDDLVMGIVARVQPHRRFDVLLKAARIVRSRNPAVKFVVLGRGTRRERLLDRPVVRMGLQDTVFPLGYRTDDYKDVLAVLDAGLMLVPGSDGSCRAALQMAAMEKPLVVAERGVLPDIVRDGESGVVVKDSPARLAEAVLELASDRERIRRWGRAAAARVRRFFSATGNAQGVQGVYERTLSAM